VAVALKLIESAQDMWRTINAPRLVTLAHAGARFEHGEPVEGPRKAEKTSRSRDAQAYRSTGLDYSGRVETVRAFVLVGGWPAAGKTTLARALASELEVAYLSKDEIKEALMDRLGAPSTVEESRRLGAAAVAAVLRAARGCPAAVIDSTWFPYSKTLARDLPGPCIEIRCRVSVEVARERYRDRQRDERHLDGLRTAQELWGDDVLPLGVGPLLNVDTTQTVDIAALAEEIRRLAAG
jgi:predicted kinase